MRRIWGIRLLGAVCVSMAMASSIFGQGGTVDSTFDIGSGVAGEVRAVAVQSDGRILIGGAFTSVGGVPRQNLARLLPEGSVDASFAPAASGPSGAVESIVVQADGNILIGGAFTVVGTSDRARVARLDPSGNVDPTFVPASVFTTGSVLTLAVQADGRIVVGGTRHSSGTRLARLMSDGTLDPTIADVSTGNVAVLGVWALNDGRLLVHGTFGVIGGVNRRFLARLLADGTVDPSFDSGAALYLSPDAVAPLPDGKLLVAGSTSVLRLDASGALDPAFRTGATGMVREMVVQSDGAILLGGSFQAIGRSTRRSLARLAGDGTLDLLFDSGLSSTAQVKALALQSDGKILAAASDGTPASKGLIRLLASGAAPPSDVPTITSVLTDGRGARLVWTDAAREEGYTVARSADGVSGWADVATSVGERTRLYDGGLDAGATYHYKVRAWNRHGAGPESPVVAAMVRTGTWGGQVDLSFDPAEIGDAAQATKVLSLADGRSIAVVFARENIHQTARWRVVRVSAMGTPELTYDLAGGYDNSVTALAMQPDGRLIVGGSFSVGGASAPRSLVRFGVDGTEDATFSASTSTDYGSGGVYAIALQPDGRMLVAGDFKTVNGIACGRIARLLASGALDTTFAPGSGANSWIRTVELDSAGRVLIAGNFSEFSNVMRGRIARLSPAGALDPTFAAGAGADGEVHAMALQSDGRLVLVGNFRSFDGSPVGRAARLQPDGALDPSFTAASTYVGNYFDSMLLRDDGRLLVGGYFYTLGGVPRRLAAGLNADGSLDLGFDVGQSHGWPKAIAATSGDRAMFSGTDARFSDGTIQRALVRIFLTGLLPPPPAPDPIAAQAHSATQIRVSWNDGPGESGYTIERSANGNAPWIVAGLTGAQVTAFIDSGLTPQTQYYYRVSAFNAQGASAPSPATYGYTLQLPVVPPGFAATAPRYSRVVLSWAAAGANESFVVERSADGIGGWVALTSAPIAVLEFVDATLPAGATAHYRVRALNSGGDSVTTASIAVTGAPPGWMSAGSTDPTFLPPEPIQNMGGIYGVAVTCILPRPDGRIVIGGTFTHLGSVARPCVAQLLADGNVDASFQPTWSCMNVAAAVLQPDSRIIAAGTFLREGNSYDYGIVRLNPDGSLDPSFNASAVVAALRYSAFYYGIHTLVLLPDGRLLAGGSALVRLHANGAHDASFAPQISDFGATPWIRRVARQGDGRLVITGDFSTVNGENRSGFVRLYDDGSLDTTFSPGYLDWHSKEALLLEPAGRIYATTQRFLASGSLDATFPSLSTRLGYDSRVYAYALQPDGKLIIGGGFVALDTFQQWCLARLTPGGARDASFDIGLGVRPGSVVAVAVQPDGAILIGGSFTSVDGQPRSGIARLLGASATWDSFQAWKIDRGLHPLASAVLDADGDGLGTLAEYALGADPARSDAAEALPLWSSGGQVHIGYRPLRADVTYIAEVSTDLATWSNEGITHGSAGVFATASFEIRPEPRKFIRLRLVR